jgi:hypothetical protein
MRCHDQQQHRQSPGRQQRRRQDRVKGSARPASARNYPSPETGCTDPHACGARYHKMKPCPKDCRRHQRPCPPPCPPDCTSHARWCPKRHGGGLVEVEVKSAAGRRGIALPDQLYALLVEHRNKQDQEREHAGTEWHDGDWMFTSPLASPSIPAATSTSGKRSCKRPGSVRRDCTMPATRRPRVSCYSASRSERSWISRAGPTPRWSSAMRMSPPGFAATSLTG